LTGQGYVKEGENMAFRAKWIACLAIMLGASLVLLVAPVYAKPKDVIIAEFNWSGSRIISQIMKHVLEDRLNVPATVKRLTPADIWTAMIWGKVDVYSDLWWPNQYEGFRKYVREEKVVEMTLSYENALQGFVIPTWVSKKHGITHIEDLKGHTKLFDFNWDGMGDLWVGESGWMATQINKIKIRSYRLHYQPFVVDNSIFLTFLKETMRARRPIIFYYWTPSWVFAHYDLTWIEEPTYDPQKWQWGRRYHARGSITCGYQPAKVYVAYTKRLRDLIPKAYQFFKNWHIALDEVSALIAEIEDVPGNPKKDPAEVARKWVADHPGSVNGWLRGIE
jgi:glycine betaine/proline transport system substrate-binding protein